MTDMVNHPSHYAEGWSNGAEVIDITENCNFNRGNAIKYLARAGKKGDATKEIEDLKKAQWYVNREIDRVNRISSMPDDEPQIITDIDRANEVISSLLASNGEANLNGFTKYKVSDFKFTGYALTDGDRIALANVLLELEKGECESLLIHVVVYEIARSVMYGFCIPTSVLFEDDTEKMNLMESKVNYWRSCLKNDNGFIHNTLLQTQVDIVMNIIEKIYGGRCL